jgi:hypothetical protein
MDQVVKDMDAVEHINSMQNMHPHGRLVQDTQDCRLMRQTGHLAHKMPLRNGCSIQPTLTEPIGVTGLTTVDYSKWVNHHSK